jgi:hypothetical protein
VFYLAWELKMPVSELCSKMTFREMIKWKAFFEHKATLERGEQDPMDLSEDDLAEAFGVG